jgi:hypothetical protein
MTTKEFEVYDRDGKRVRRDGILQDGDRMVTKMLLMDAANPALADAVARAEAVKRALAFDASKGVSHKPGYSTQDAGTSGLDARLQRDARLVDAWREPPSVTKNDATALEQVAVVGRDAPDAQLFAARDAAVAARDMRLERSWEGN